MYRNDNGTEIIALERDPVLNNEWKVEKQSDGDFGLVYYTMTITDDMLN